MSRSKPDHLQRTIMDAAIAIAAGVGPDAISMRELAREAHVSHQAPYHHFGDRAGIFAAISEEGFAALGDSMQLRKALGAESMCETYVQFAISHKGHFRVMFRSDLCNIANSPNAKMQADRAFNLLQDEVMLIVGNSADPESIRAQTAYMWSVAHGLATLLIDGPLLKKFGTEINVNALIKNVARMASSSIGV